MAHRDGVHMMDVLEVEFHICASQASIAACQWAFLPLDKPSQAFIAACLLDQLHYCTVLTIYRHLCISYSVYPWHWMLNLC